MVKRGGEPITVSSAVATGLLTAIEELYRDKNKGGKSKKGGGSTGMLGSEIGASHLLLDPNAAVERPFTSPAIGGSNKNNNNTKKSKKNVGGGHNVGELHPADVTAPLTIVMNADGSMPQVGGKKNTKSKKEKKGGDPVSGVTHDFSGVRNVQYASVDAPQTILMSEKQIGGKKVKKSRGGAISDEEVYNSAMGAIPVPNPPVQQGGKKKRVNRKKGGDNESGLSSEPVVESAPVELAPVETAVGESAPVVGGKRNKKDKKLIGGLAELSAVLQSLSKM